MALERVPLSLGVRLLVLDRAQLTLNRLAHLVQTLRLVLQRVDVILFALQQHVITANKSIGL